MAGDNYPILQKDTRAREQTCVKCGKRFLIRPSSGRYPLPASCGICRREKRLRLDKERKDLENQEWQKKKALENQEYLDQLPNWNMVSRDSIQPRADQVLYILGNGFDLMHRVPPAIILSGILLERTTISVLLWRISGRRRISGQILKMRWQSLMRKP